MRSAQSKEMAAVRLDMLHEAVIRAKLSHKRALEDLHDQGERVRNAEAVLKESLAALDAARLSLTDTRINLSTATRGWPVHGEGESMCDPRGDFSAEVPNDR